MHEDIRVSSQDAGRQVVMTAPQGTLPDYSGHPLPDHLSSTAPLLAIEEHKNYGQVVLQADYIS